MTSFYTEYFKMQRLLVEGLRRREEAELLAMGIKRFWKENDMKKCNNCGRAYAVPAVGSTVRNRWSMMLGVVVGPGTLHPETTVKVAVITGANKGELRNWFIDNAQVVHGHFHIDTKED